MDSEHIYKLSEGAIPNPACYNQNQVTVHLGSLNIFSLTGPSGLIRGYSENLLNLLIS